MSNILWRYEFPLHACKKDDSGHYGCASISVRNVNVTFGIGSKNFDVGTAYTTASGFNISWSGGHCMYVGKYAESVSPQAGKNKTKIERKAKG